eukprot:CCRYP_000194-RA/>CCRYP_000194-RA protein AED:0.43 eAED:0.25 QI:0/0/0/0.5/1/1/2/0/947
MTDSDVDLSSFPLLRIDQVRRHSTETLVESERQISELKDIDCIATFVSKLLAQIRQELFRRRGRSADTLGAGTDEPVTQLLTQPSSHENLNNDTRLSATERKSSSKSPLKEKSGTNATPTPRHHKPPPTISFFVPNSPKSKASSFRSRSKLAKASLNARSHDAITRECQQLRKERTRIALATMREWRMQREQWRQRREKLMAEERRNLRIRRRERREREERVKSSMQEAALEAKELALQSGFSNEEAILEAAAAAARVIDDDSTVFDESCAGCSDVVSFPDDDVGGDDFLGNDSATSSTVIQDIIFNKSSETSQQVGIQEKFVAIPDSYDKSISHSKDIKILYNVTDEITVSPNNCEMVCDHVLASVHDDDITAEKKSFSAHDNDNTSENVSLTGRSDRNPDDALDDANEDAATCKQKINKLDIISDTFEEGASILKSESPRYNKGKQIEEDCPFALERDITSNNAHNEEERFSPPIPKPKRFLDVFPSFSHIFSPFVSGVRSKSDELDFIKCLQIQLERISNLERLVDPGIKSESYGDHAKSLLRYHIKSHRPEVVDIIRKTLSNCPLNEWEEIHDGTWNLLWTWGMPNAADFDHLMVFQKISRFRLTRGLTRKDLLKKNIERCDRKSKGYSFGSNSEKGAFHIMPLTYALPHEYNAFVSGFTSIQNASGSKRSNVWIIKPIGLSRGRGISLVDNITDVSYSQPIVIQKYIDDPLCFMGYKFDLRVYILVTSFSPLEAFIYREGLARFGSRKYTTNAQSIHDLRIHLTNSSIQKEFGGEVDRSHPAFLAGSSNGAESKVAMTWLWKRLDDIGIDSKLLWSRIVDVCTKALVAGGSGIPFQPNSFELFGFDLMFDQNLKCWLIEVNSSPSLSCETKLDVRIKGNLIRDTIALVDPPLISHEALACICTRRLSRRKDVSNLSSGAILEQDLRRIFKDKIPRVYVSTIV